MTVCVILKNVQEISNLCVVDDRILTIYAMCSIIKYCNNGGKNMKKGLRSLIITALAMMVLTLSCFAAGKTFKDVPEKSWYTEAVAFVSEKGYMGPVFLCVS